jgi:hypothetical protein
MNAFLVVFGLTELFGLMWRIHCDSQHIRHQQSLKDLEARYRNNYETLENNLRIERDHEKLLNGLIAELRGKLAACEEGKK